MNKNSPTASIILLTFFCLSTNADDNIVSSVESHQEGNNIVIEYDLQKNADIKLYVSLDGGANYERVDEKCLQGDFDKVNIESGNAHKKIQWDVLCQYSSFISDNVVFLVDAENIPQEKSYNDCNLTLSTQELNMSSKGNETEYINVSGVLDWHFRNNNPQMMSVRKLNNKCIQVACFYNSGEYRSGEIDIIFCNNKHKKINVFQMGEFVPNVNERNRNPSKKHRTPIR